MLSLWLRPDTQPEGHQDQADKYQAGKSMLSRRPMMRGPLQHPMGMEEQATCCLLPGFPHAQ